MKFRDIIDLPIGVRYCFELLELQSGFTRQVLLDQQMMTNPQVIEAAFEELELYYNIFIEQDRERIKLHNLQFKLKRLKDVRGSVSGLDSSRVLNEIELFEIKSLAMLYEDVREFLTASPLGYLTPDCDMESVIKILDPDGVKAQAFYIYDSYSQQLKEIRSAIARLGEKDLTKQQELLVKGNEIEAEIRSDLSRQLKPYAKTLSDSLFNLAKIDASLAKVLLICDGFISPSVSESNDIKGLFNPFVKDILEKKGKLFQEIDISFDGVTVIVGSNMGGKTVLLKTIALAQTLFQFGYPIPAQKAELRPKRAIYISVGDDQSEEAGISSFGAEMKKINRIIEAAREGEDILALIDEPARSTNPIEGTALVSSLIKLLLPFKMDLIIATHYNIDDADHQNQVAGFRKLKVKGLTENGMDYSLIDTIEKGVPEEALKIAGMLGIDSQWIEMAKEEMSINNK